MAESFIRHPDNANQKLGFRRLSLVKEPLGSSKEALDANREVGVGSAALAPLVQNFSEQPW